MDSALVIGAFAVLAIIALAKRGKVTPEPEVDAEDIREAKEKGWYNTELTRGEDGEPLAILSGKLTNGEPYKGAFAISERDWQQLKKEGYKEYAAQ